MDYPPTFRELIDALKQLPSIGPRSAERLALFLAGSPTSISSRLAHALTNTVERIKPCPECGFFSDDSHCVLCNDPKRDRTLLCVVEHAGDVIRLERSGSFRGLYHVLGGRLSPLEGVGPEQLRIADLEERIKKNPPQEIVLALGADVEGETTALYLVPKIKAHGIRVSRLATGLPAGGGLEFADAVTLGYALQGRREL